MPEEGSQAPVGRFAGRRRLVARCAKHSRESIDLYVDAAAARRCGPVLVPHAECGLIAVDHQTDRDTAFYHLSLTFDYSRVSVRANAGLHSKKE